MQVCQSAIGSDQEPSPQHRVDASNPGMDQVDRGRRRRVHDHDSLASNGFNGDRRVLSEEPAMGLVCPRFEMDSYFLAKGLVFRGKVNVTEPVQPHFVDAFPIHT